MGVTAVAVRVVMPQMGYDMREGKIVRWVKKEGEEVRRGETLAEIETDKAVVEMPASGEGVLRKILVPEGETVPVGHLIAVIAAPDEPLPEDLAALPSAEAPAPPPVEAPSPPTPTPPPPPGPERVRASPLARRLAQELGVDLTQVQGTGPGGRITERDVQAFAQRRGRAPAEAPPAPAPAEEAEVVEVSRMRLAIARLTTRSKQEIPHFYVTNTVDMTEAMALRSQVNQALSSQGVRVSVNDLLVKACVLALKKYPDFNASYEDGRLVRHRSINIGIAIALENGLIVGVIPRCESRSLVDIAQASKALVERAQEGRMRAEDYTGATFSISNLGMYDIENFTAIIYPPNAAVLAVGSVRREPVVKGDQVAIAQVMRMTLSIDHRVADGAQAAQFMAHLKWLLEHPVHLLVQ